MVGEVSRRGTSRPEQNKRRFAQCIAVCRAYKLAEARGISSLFQCQSRAKRGASSGPTRAHVCQLRRGVLAVLEQKPTIRCQSGSLHAFCLSPRDGIKWDSVERSTPVMVALEALDT